ncbi:hypothetical protein [Roseococcus thiosulfatophilus]|uniref:hypothetical protein n=1 Tax=Roseococcus thiosulfatophilus TaxID=35813 RepID=UPI001A90B0BD|nr:hypothetical protein [Roseococcus thiosulfatophilus]
MTVVTIPVQPDRDAAVHFPTSHAGTIGGGRGGCHAPLARGTGEYVLPDERMPMIWSVVRIRAGKACRWWQGMLRAPCVMASRGEMKRPAPARFGAELAATDQSADNKARTSGGSRARPSCGELGSPADILR